MVSDEFSLISSIKSKFPPPDGVLGIGDDCAAIPQTSGRETLVSTDMLVEGVHFLRNDIAPFDLGWKSAAVNLSDIAAMGGRPEGSFLSLALPQGMPSEWMDSFLEGYKAISDGFSCPLLGGDTNSSKTEICINVTVLGSAAKGQSIKRNGAREGDLIYVTGPLGDCGAGLRLILEGSRGNRSELENYLIHRHCHPIPRIREGMLLAETGGISAMMDISDGVASDLSHILELPGVGAEIDLPAIPISEQLKEICTYRGWDPLKLALESGEDYELLFCVSSDKVSGIETTMAQNGFGCFRIGHITSDKGNIRWKGSDGDFHGFRHKLQLFSKVNH